MTEGEWRDVSHLPRYSNPKTATAAAKRVRSYLNVADSRVVRRQSTLGSKLEYYVVQVRDK